MKQPEVSVVLPTRDRAAVVTRAITSVLAQTISDWELIVVDDGSRDDTLERIRAFTDPRIRVLCLTDPGGSSRARNEGIGASRGRLVAFLDSDDEWLPTKLERQLTCVAGDPAVTVVYCGHRRVDDRTGRTSATLELAPEGRMFRALARGWSPAMSGVVVRRSALLEVGRLDPALPAFVDYDLLLRIARTGGRFAAVADVLVVKHDYGGPQISTTPGRLREGFERMDAKWRQTLRADLGVGVYRRWRGQLRANVEHARIRDDVAHGRRLRAWRGAVAGCRFAPWAARSVASSLVLAVLGARGYAAALGLKDALSPLVDEGRRG